MEIKEIKNVPLLQRLQENIWPCGDLRTGCIAVGLTSLISTFLLTFYYIENFLAFHKFSLEIVAVGLVALFLALSDIALIYGSVLRVSMFFVPWLVLHTFLQVFLIFYLSFKFVELPGVRGVILISFLIIWYFLLTTFLHYKQLIAPKDPQESSDDANNPQCLIDLENLNGAPVAVTSGAGDETFTALASRDATTVASGAAAASAAATTLDDSGEFTMPASATESKSFSFPLNDSFCKPLPTPEEVIEVKKSTNPFLTEDLKNDETEDGEATDALLPQAEVSKRPISTSKNDLVDMKLVDNSFTPYKPKKADDSTDGLPKMKVFLPKSDDEEEDDCSSSSNSSN